MKVLSRTASLFLHSDTTFIFASVWGLGALATAFAMVVSR